MTSSEFTDALDQHVQLASGSEAYFGRDVLRGLVDGLRAANESIMDWELLHQVHGPVVLGSTMSMDDPDIMTALENMASACVVITKQPTYKMKGAKWERLVEFSQSHEHGLLAQAFPELEGLAPHNEGQARVVGPYEPDARLFMSIDGVREVGFRKVGERMVPIVHAKIALLGDIWSMEQSGDGWALTIPHFVPRRLWVGSANFTESSRRSLEMGFWTTEKDLMEAARRFLVGLIAMSEPLGSGPDDLSPELLPVDYDNDAFLELYTDEPEP